MILIGLVLSIVLNSGGGGSDPTASLSNSFWNVFINPFAIPTNIHPMIWQDTLIKSRIFLILGGVVFLMTGLLNLQKREKFM
jgi:ABC-type sugar transport system permease subunit